MECKVCGRTISNEAANFCDYCGTSVKEEVGIGQQANKEMNREIKVEEIKMNSEPQMNFKKWLVVMLLPFIPIVGSVIYIVLLFLWAFGTGSTATQKSWARATLCVFVVSLISLIVMMPTLLNMAMPMK